MVKTLKNRITLFLITLSILAFALGFIAMPKLNFAQAETTSIGFYLEDGAGVNVSDNEDAFGRKYKSIRWVCHVSEEFYNSLQTVTTEGRKVFGVAVTPAYEGKDQELQETLTRFFEFDETIQSVEFVNGDFVFSLHVTYNDVLEDATDDAYDLPLLARPYYKTADGTVCYGEYGDTIRSITGVALYHIIEGTYPVGSDEYVRLLEYVPNYNPNNVVTKNYSALNGASITVCPQMADVDRVFLSALDVTGAYDKETNALTFTNATTILGDKLRVTFLAESGNIEVYNYSVAQVKVNGELANSTVELYAGEQATISVNVGDSADIIPYSVTVEDEFANVITADGNVISPLEAGDAIATVSYVRDDVSYSFDLNVKSYGELYRVEQTYQLSAYDGVLFKGSDVVELSDIISGGVTKIETASGRALTYTDGKILGYNSTSKEGLIQDSLYVYTADRTTVLFVDVATLILDQAEDFAYFSYKGAFDPSTYTEAVGANGATQANAATFGKAAYTDASLKWNGYYLMVKDIDASTATYGTADNKHWISGAEANGSIIYTSGASAKYYVDNGNYGDYNAHFNAFSGYYDGSQGIRGLSGTFDGNGYTLSNFVASYDGIFGFIKNATVKNLGLINNSKLGRLAFGATFDNMYVSKANGEATLVTASDTATTKSEAKRS